MNVQNFIALCHQLTRIDFDGKLWPPPPWPGPRPTKKWVPIVRTKVERGGDAIPDKYVKAFIGPLRGALDSLVRENPPVFETLAGAVYQHAPGYDLTPQLRRFLAVVSDLFQSFLHRERLKKVGIHLDERLPPLATFKYVGKGGPFTYEFDNVNLIGASVGVVSLPAIFANHPLLWASLAHETGGHDVVHAIPGLLEELQARVGEKALAEISVPQLSHEKLVALWEYWMDETVADVYGILNVGPVFGLTMAAYHAALSSQQPPRLAIPKVRMGSNDEHPPAILRIHLAIGAVESLEELSEAKLHPYVADLKRLADLCKSGHLVEISGPGLGDRKKAKLPLAEMQEAARQVGKYIATVPLKALGHLSIQDIETWDDRDEGRAEKVKAALAARKPIIGLGDDAQLLAGAAMYLLDHPNHYARVAKPLADALDHSFDTDPIWGRRRSRSASMIQATSTSHRTPNHARLRGPKLARDRSLDSPRHG